MEEIHAYQNKNGTYKVEIIRSAEQVTYIDKHEIRQTTESKIEIPRASILITVYKPEEPSTSLCTISISES